ncbi:glycosyltransferase family 4 protein [Methylorubrum sp. SL192]|uniref:glycosyltransferase family 4 protein n=1 Tax=Methylorubrum sp. SL192 TaxID=2995167 RepID=UPI0022746A42|nr:glycosyltransferase family 4 protein [Methylorubrum sp. SL192]MCY1641026.1 glycosyltransferase family 4 protein [Methylorubrum sp. SL192]
MKRLKILAPQRYPWTFTGPRASRHDITRAFFIPANKISPKIEGITAFPTVLFKPFDLVHAFNRIPLGRTPYVIGCESHIPRGFGIETSALYKRMARSLASQRCRAIIPISRYASGLITRDHEHRPWWPALKAKMVVRHPSIATRPFQVGPPPSPIRIAFVGNHFARKGGCVAVRIAELAARRGIPVEVHIVSGLEMGAAVWTDPTRDAFFDPYRRLLDRPNVTLHPTLPNREVLDLLGMMHFSVLTTFSDTFGYSALESMACGTPVIASRQGALPEFIHDGVNGIMLDLPTNPWGEWIHGGHTGRHTVAYEAIVRDDIERLAEEALTAVERHLSDDDGYRRMRRAAYAEIETRFDIPSSSAFWDDLYQQAISNGR